MQTPFNTYPNRGDPTNEFIANNLNQTSPGFNILNIASTTRKRIYPSNGSNFNESFVPNVPLIESWDTTNRNNVLNNNLKPNVLVENIVEYHINIDSDDRDIKTYPDPFYYTVSFKALGRSRFSNDPCDKENYEIIPETPAPVIIRSFKNVKFVRIDRVILSRYCVKKYQVNQCIEICNNKLVVYTKVDCIRPFENENKECSICTFKDCKCHLANNYKFINLRMKELQSNHIYSTNSETSDNSFILSLDKSIGVGYNTWICPFGSVIFPTTLLYNLNRLTIEFLDSRGKRINTGIIIEYNMNIKINNDPIEIQLIIVTDSTNLEIVQVEKYKNKQMISFSSIFNINIWFQKIFDNIISKIQDKKIVEILMRNYDTIYKSINTSELLKKIKTDISNNVFLIVGVMENELGTTVKYNL